MRLTERIVSIRRQMEQGAVTNDAAVRQVIVDPLLRSLDWDTSDGFLVRPKYPLKDSEGAGHADYALFSPDGKVPMFLIELRQVGRIRDRNSTQLLQYARAARRALVGLTDGRSWSFFLPFQPGAREERHVRTIDLLDDDPNEAGNVLSQYLWRSSVQSGQAHRDAELDWTVLRETARIRDGIEAAWTSIRTEPHADLVGLIARETERRAHTRPDRHTVESFIRDGFRFSGRSEPASARAATWTYRGQRRSEKYAIDMYVHIIEQLWRDHGGDDFYRDLQQQIKGRRRANIGRTPEEADPRQRDIRKLAGGWYLSTNLSNAEKLKRIKVACAVAGIKYGRDLTVSTSGSQTSA